MKRRESFKLLAAPLLATSSFPSIATEVIRTGRDDLPCLPGFNPNGRPRAAVLGLSGNGCAAVGELRHRSECGEFNRSAPLKWFDAINPVIEPDLVQMSRYGRVPNAILRPMANPSWLTHDLQNVALLIVLGNLRCPQTRMYLPGFLVEAARLGVSTLVGVIEPWVVVGGEVRRPKSAEMEEYLMWLRCAAGSLVVIQEDFAEEAMLQWSALNDGDSYPIDGPLSKLLGKWNRDEIEKLVEVGQAALI